MCARATLSTWQKLIRPGGTPGCFLAQTKRIMRTQFTVSYGPMIAAGLRITASRPRAMTLRTSSSARNLLRW